MTEKYTAIEILRKKALPSTLLRLERVLDQRTRRLTVVLEDLSDSRNSGAIIRTCECLGLQEVHVVINRNPYRARSQVLRGAANWLEVHKHVSSGSTASLPCLRQLRSRGFCIAATTLRSDLTAIHPQAVPVDRPVALCFGLEQRGLSDAVHEFADLHVQIPMRGFTQSLNVACSAAICIHDVLERVHAGEVDWRLGPDDRERILLGWLKRKVRHADRLLLDAGHETGAGRDAE